MMTEGKVVVVVVRTQRKGKRKEMRVGGLETREKS
jgi:hypothetical protein